ncbi:PEP-CTERM sorting domain-containing protein [Nitrosomonas aestuarii]|uniref:PEP-CTERM sorting domain-containing protein n=1 Tax=Nitrosomonas aestuarii TaxID=52441 RepID=UPI000D3243EE|nr:PEP-CTERM sorting domain-containing protein [Nitrosomonas aestuarii]PTN09419.1 putative secreted protein with PEP-CTERM sorting signal [Nitrosomonas aestuarii]
MQNKIRLIGLVAVTVFMAMASTVHATYWNLFNIEGESSISASYVTYGSLNDMLTDTNRLSNSQPNSFGFGSNIVGSGSDGTTYWNLFNIEGESSISASYVTYGSLNDMLTDTNRLSNSQPNSFGFGSNIVGSGSDGTTYWNLFNIEGESSISASYVTYGSLNDMLTDTNRLSNSQPNSFGFGSNIVGSGSDNKASNPDNPRPVPESPILVLLGIGLAGFAVARRKKINEH